jgi:DNA invertase Pin-like site-specific DNA recombinase
MATVAYGRVSTAHQDTENQRLELVNADWSIMPGASMGC